MKKDTSGLKLLIQHVSLMKNCIVPFFALFLAGCSSDEGGIGVVDLPGLYAEFDYQKELAVEYKKVEEKITSEKDSLNRAIQVVELSLSQAPDYTDADKGIIFDRAYSSYLAQQEYLDYVQDSIASDYSAKVWKQLNSYMQQYGEENSYDVIIGMQGDGNVMYAKEGVNITEDVIVYSNNKYNGK